MELSFSEELVKAIGIKVFSAFKFVSDDAFNWHHNLELDLNDLTLEQIDKLQKLVAEHETIYGAKRLVKDMKIWIKARTTIKTITVKRFVHFDSLLIEFVRKLPHHWLFRKHSQDNEVYVPYYVSNIKYHPPERSRDYYHPAYVQVECVYERFGEKHGESFTFYSGDVMRKTIPDILITKFGLLPENSELFNNHAKEVKRYSSLIPQIGKQFTVHGPATDDVPNGSRYGGSHNFTFAEDRRKNRVVIDTFHDKENEENDSRHREPYIDDSFWQRRNPRHDNDEDEDVDDYDDSEDGVEAQREDVHIPIHTYLVVFDLFRHLRLAIHVNYLDEYIYDEKLAEKLILPQDVKSLVTMLVEQKEGNFKDIVAGKGGGAIILLTGSPGVGKTLTAEVFAEADKKPLYSVQASQLGTDPENLEKQLMIVLQRAARWNAIMLLDEADVYVHERGNDLQQNAIVGVFLRVLEYHASILFLTTNRPDLVDDAIASRCVARIDYQYPTKDDQRKIWKVLSEASDIKIKEKEYADFADKHPKISGRDVKNLLKLAALISAARNETITTKLLEYVYKFKPTIDRGDNNAKI